MLNERREIFEINIQKLIMAYLSRWWLILGVAILAALMSWYYTANFITPMYQASVKIYVNNIRADQRIEYITGGNLETAQQLVKTYVTIIKSDTVLEQVAEASGMDISAAYIRGAMSVRQVDETEVFTVTITSADPEKAAALANAIAKVAPDAIAEFVEGSSTKIIDYAKVPTHRSSPNQRRNALLGFMTGGAVAALFVTLLFLTDVRIKDEEDLTALFDLPVLAQIPVFTTSSGKNRGRREKTANKGDLANGEKGGDR